MPFRKKQPNLVRNVVISSESFMYVMENRHSNHEPFYKVLDRVLKEHDKLTSKESKEDLDEEETDINLLDNR